MSMRCRRPSSIAAVGAALLAWPRPAIAATDGAAVGSGTMTLPLLSHRHVVDRRRRELRAAGHQPGHDHDGAHQLDHHDDYDRVPSPHRTAGSSNLRRLDQQQQQLGALYQGYGTHYVDIWVGYPAQRQTAVVDTGSSVTAFPCSECHECGKHADAPFQEGDSESFRATHCPQLRGEGGCVFGKCDANGMCIVEHDFGLADGGGAGDGGAATRSGWTAFEASDVAYAGGPHDRAVDHRGGTAGAAAGGPGGDDLDPGRAPEFSFPLTFGCQTSATGYFEKQLASGVMGMDRRAQSFWGQMRDAQVIKRAQFSLCFVRQPIASVSGSTAGAVTLGGADGRLHKTPMVFAKSVGNGSTASFKVRMRKMYLRRGNDQSVMSSNKSKYHLLDVSEDWLNGGEMYNFDSGTTDTYFIQSLSGEFRKVWRDVTGMDYTNDPISFDSDSDILKFPTLVLQMVPHNGGVGDEVQTADPREVPGLAGNVDVTLPNDVMVAIPPKHYMQRNYKDKTFTSRIYLDRDNALGNVLGANSMMGHDILFDMDEARIGFAESDCDYAGLVAASARGELGEGDMTPAASAGIAGELSSTTGGSGEDNYELCRSAKCRGFFGLTLAVFFACFFLFARRYVARRGGDGRVPVRVGANEYEMKASSRNLHAGGRGRAGPYTDDGDDDDGAPGLPGGERRAYYDEGPPGEYSDRHRSTGRRPDRPPGRRDRSGSREGERERRGRGEGRRYRDGGGPTAEGRRSSSRDSADGNGRSSHSIHSGRSHRSRGSQGSSGSGSSGGSRETKRSSRSHRSSRSRESQRSHRSRQSRSSRHSSGSRERRHHGDRDLDDRHHYRDEYGDMPSIT